MGFRDGGQDFAPMRCRMSLMGHSRLRWSSPKLVHVRSTPIATVTHQNVIRR